MLIPTFTSEPGSSHICGLLANPPKHLTSQEAEVTIEVGIEFQRCGIPEYKWTETFMTAKNSKLQRYLSLGSFLDLIGTRKA